jgi:hypothetical protein
MFSAVHAAEDGPAGELVADAWALLVGGDLVDGGADCRNGDGDEQDDGDGDAFHGSVLPVP